MNRFSIIIIYSAILIVLFPMGDASAELVMGVGLSGGSILYDKTDFENVTGFDCTPGTPTAFSGLFQVEFIRALPIRFEIMTSVDDAPARYGGEPASVEFRDTGFNFMALYRFYDPPLSPVSLHIGGGGGFRLISTKVAGDVVPDGFENVMIDNETVWDLKGMGGLEIAVPSFNISFILEGRYNYLYSGDDPITFPEFIVGTILFF